MTIKFQWSFIWLMAVVIRMVYNTLSHACTHARTHTNAIAHWLWWRWWSTMMLMGVWNEPNQSTSGWPFHLLKIATDFSQHIWYNRLFWWYCCYCYSSYAFFLIFHLFIYCFIFHRFITAIGWQIILNSLHILMRFSNIISIFLRNRWIYACMSFTTYVSFCNAEMQYAVQIHFFRSFFINNCIWWHHRIEWNHFKPNLFIAYR